METAASSKTLCHMFFNLARSEKKVEIIKQMLCQFEDFEPYSAFKRIARREPAISAASLSAFLQENQQFFDASTIKRTFLRRYDENRDELLSFSEYFCFFPLFLRKIS